MRVTKLKPRTRSRLFAVSLLLIGLSTAAENLTPRGAETRDALAGEPRTVEAVATTRSGTCPNAG